MSGCEVLLWNVCKSLRSEHQDQKNKRFGYNDHDKVDRWVLDGCLFVGRPLLHVSYETHGYLVVVVVDG